jgi:hypothetical protein
VAGTDLLSRLADAGEEAIARLGKLPGGEQVAGAMHAMRERMDELQKRTMGIEGLEKRIGELEQRIAALEGAKRRPARRAASQTGRAATKRKPTRSTASEAARRPLDSDSSAAVGGDSPG